MFLSVSHIDELLLLFIGHVSQAVVASRQVSLQAGQGGDHHPLHLPALGPGAGRRQAEPADAAAGPDAGGQDVLLIEHAVGDLSAEGGDTGLSVGLLTEEETVGGQPWRRPGRWGASWFWGRSRCVGL